MGERVRVRIELIGAPPIPAFHVKNDAGIAESRRPDTTVWSGHVRMGVHVWRHLILPALRMFCAQLELPCDVQYAPPVTLPGKP